jgi:putative RecB family exonuclease
MNTLLLEDPATVAAEEQRSSGVWDYVSPSRLNLWLRCPLAFKLKYIDGIVPPPTPSLFLGKRVHDALEVFYRHRHLAVDFSVEAAARRITDSWDQAAELEAMQFKSLDECGKLKQQAIDLVTAYLQQVTAANTACEIPLAVETSMEAPLIDLDTGENLGIPLTGIVDLIADDRDGPLICDFKTAAKSAAPFEVTHEIQLSSYAYLFREATGDEEGGLEIRSLIKTKVPKIEFHRYRTRSEAHFRRLFAVIRAYLDDLDANRFVFRPGFGCVMCDYRDGSCRDWDG